MRNFLTILAVTLLVVAVLFSFGVTKSSKYAWLGVSGQTVDDDLAEAFDLAIDHGAIVNQVLDDSPADEAGMREGDIIIDFDGEEVYAWDDLIDALENLSPGDQVQLRVMRDDREREFEVTLEGKPRYYRSKHRSHDYYSDVLPHIMVPDIPRLPKIPSIPAIPNLSDHYYFSGQWDGSYIGVSLSDLSDQLGEYFGVKKGRGALVMDVHEDSPAAEAGLKAGDVIIAVDGEEVFEADDVSEIVDDFEEGEKLTITVLREKNEETVEVVVGERSDHYGDEFRWVGPNIDIRIPHMKGLHNGVYFDDLEDYLDSDDFEDFREEIEEFEEEMEELQEELRDLKYDHKESLREELEELRDELDDFKDRLD